MSDVAKVKIIDRKLYLIQEMSGRLKNVTPQAKGVSVAVESC